MLPVAMNVIGAVTVIMAFASLPPKRARSNAFPSPTAITVPVCATVATLSESVPHTTAAGDTTSPLLVRTVAVTTTDRGSPGGRTRFMEAGDSSIVYVAGDATSVLPLHARTPSVVRMKMA
jgi:hypothetical protein